MFDFYTSLFLSGDEEIFNNYITLKNGLKSDILNNVNLFYEKYYQNNINICLLTENKIYKLYNF